MTTPSPELRLDQSICAAASAGPAKVMPPDLDQMTLFEWGTVLRRAVADVAISDPKYVPLWVACAALDAVGLGAAVPGLLGRLSEPGLRMRNRLLPEELAMAKQWATPLPGSPPSAPKLTVLVLVPSGQSAAKAWTRSDRAGVLLLTPGDAAALLTQPPALLNLQEAGGMEHLVLAGVPLSDSVVLGIRDLLKANAEQQRRPFTCWDLSGSDQPGPDVRGLKPAPLIEDLLAQLAKQVTPTFYSHTFGRNDAGMAPALRDWLALPSRRARGRLKVERGSWLMGLLTGQLLRGIPRGNYQISYEATARDPDSAGNQRETVQLSTHDMAGGRPLATIELVVLGNTISARTARFTFLLAPEANKDGIELRTVNFSSESISARLLNPRWYCTVHAQEGGFGLSASVRMWGFTVLRLQGDFAPGEMAGEHPVASSPPYHDSVPS